MITSHTLGSYLGPEFQQRLVWQILVEPEFAEKIIPELSIDYFDDPNLKRLFLIILEFYNEFEKVPNLQNQSIYQAINKYKTPNNPIEEELLYSLINKIKLWNDHVLNRELFNDSDIIQKSAYIFIKQQEYRKLGEFILDKTKTGEIKDKKIIGDIDEKIQKISHIGNDEDAGTDVFDDIDRALRKEFRQTIPTGIDVLDSLTGGGLGKSEIGIILAPSGTGKTTLLTKIANTARELDYNVLQIVFEDTEDQIKRKHYAIWSGIPLSKMDDNNELVAEKVKEKLNSLGRQGRLIIKRFSQEDTTMKDIRNWIIRYQKKYGFKFDIVVLDYLDCVDSHKKTTDRNDAELTVVKSFEAMAGDFNIPCWSAIQSNRSGIDAELVEANQTGGNIKRMHKAHLYMSIAKTVDQKEAHLANIRIIKARFAQDGQTFKDCIFNNDTMNIIIRDDRYPALKNKGLKKYDTVDVDRIEKKITQLDVHSKINEKLSENELENNALNDLANAYKNYKTEVFSDEVEKNNDIIEENNSIIEENKHIFVSEIQNKTDENINTDSLIEEELNENEFLLKNILNDMSKGQKIKDND